MTESSFDRDAAIEAIRTTRSMRRLSKTDIPDDVLHDILDAAIRAPSGSNQQPWSFIVVRDHETKNALQRIYHDVAMQYFDAAPTTIGTEGGEAVMKRVRGSARHLAEHLHEAPVLIVACIKGESRFSLGASIFPAVQNLMIAARAFGIGTTLTTFHLAREDDVKDLLGIPEDVQTAAIIPLGYPTGRWAVPQRLPVEDVTFLDRFDAKLWQSRKS